MKNQKIAFADLINKREFDLSMANEQVGKN